MIYHNTLSKKINEVHPKSSRGGEKEREQEVRDDLSICAMNTLLKLSNLSRLFAINFLEMKI